MILKADDMDEVGVTLGNKNSKLSRFSRACDPLIISLSPFLKEMVPQSNSIKHSLSDKSHIFSFKPQPEEKYLQAKLPVTEYQVGRQH